MSVSFFIFSTFNITCYHQLFYKRISIHGSLSIDPHVASYFIVNTKRRWVSYESKRSR